MENALAKQTGRARHYCHDPACRVDEINAETAQVRRERTERARAVYRQRFERAVDAMGPKSPAEREALLRQLRSAHFAGLVSKRWAKRDEQAMAT